TRPAPRPGRHREGAPGSRSEQPGRLRRRGRSPPRPARRRWRPAALVIRAIAPRRQARPPAPPPASPPPRAAAARARPRPGASGRPRPGAGAAGSRLASALPRRPDGPAEFLSPVRVRKGWVGKRRTGDDKRNAADETPGPGGPTGIRPRPGYGSRASRSPNDRRTRSPGRPPATSTANIPRTAAPVITSASGTPLITSSPSRNVTRSAALE